MSIGSNATPVLADASVVTIPAAAGSSGAFKLGARSLVGIATPATLVSTSLTLAGCDTEGGTYLPIRDYAGNVLTITVGTSRHIVLPPVPFGLLPRYIKLTTAATEGAVREITMFTRPLY
jgi:hypothetical protein